MKATLKSASSSKARSREPPLSRVDMSAGPGRPAARGVLRTSSPIQRFHRDLGVLAVHAFLDIDTASETMGRFTLDLPVADPLL